MDTREAWRQLKASGAVGVMDVTVTPASAGEWVYDGSKGRYWREFERRGGYLCRCGYDADDMADLGRHITSWERWFAESGQVERIAECEHVED